MRAFRWLFITGGICVVLAVLAIAIGTVWLNSFIHSAAFRREVEAQAARTLGGPVDLQAIDFNYFGGVQLRGFATQIDAGRSYGQGAIVAKVQSVNCTYSWDALLHRQLKFIGVTLEKPEIVLTRQPVSAVAIAPPLPPPAPVATGAPAAAAPAASPGAPAPEAAVPKGALPSGAAPFQFLLETAKISDGSLSIRNAAGAALAELHGIDATADTSGYAQGKDITGTLKIAELVLPSHLHITDLSTGFTYRTGALEAKPLEATAFDGRLAGDYESGTTGPSIFELNAKGLDVAQIGRMVDAASPAKLTGSLDLQSKWQRVETGEIKGEGDAQLTGGTLQGVSVLDQLGAILRIKELKSPSLHKVQTHFQVANGQTRFTSLQIDAGIFQMTGSGVIGMKGQLDANMVLILTRDAMKRLPREAAMFFVQQPDGSASIAYHLGGTIDNPQTDLATRLFMQNMQMQNVIKKALNRFFH